MSDRPSSSFVPPDYEPPKKSGNYLKLKKPGDTVFRILSDSALMGEEGWKWKQGRDKPTPVRKPVGAVWNHGEYDTRRGDRNPLKHFWALAVWNYEVSRVQVLVITQTTIQDAIKALSRNKKWGHPRDYDLCVTASGSGMETEYAVMPEPKSPLPAEARIAWAECRSNGFDLSRLFSNGDPFGEEGNGAAAARTAISDSDQEPDWSEDNPPTPDDGDLTSPPF